MMMVHLGGEGRGITPVVLVGFRETGVRGSTLVGLVLMLVPVLVAIEAFLSPVWKKLAQEAEEMAMAMAMSLHALQN